MTRYRTKRITTDVTPDVDERLIFLAKNAQMTKSEFVRKLIEDELKQHEGKGAVSGTHAHSTE